MTIEIKRGLSIKQPWLWLIINYYKDIEIRTWNTSYRGLIALQSSKHFDKPGFEYLKTKGFFKDKKQDSFCRGMIEGYAYIYDIIDFKGQKHFEQYKDRHHNNPEWFDGKQKGFIFTDINEIYPIRYKGSLGLFYLKEPMVING